MLYKGGHIFDKLREGIVAYDAAVVSSGTAGSTVRVFSHGFLDC